ncbi:MAG: hypothetical protein BGO98_39650 [Myxococcales bacterium 68-20]|nr:MAG: hypothetical protein BGO98_39650 [Myxococcales bacterium 68-20]
MTRGSSSDGGRPAVGWTNRSWALDVELRRARRRARKRGALDCARCLGRERLLLPRCGDRHRHSRGNVHRVAARERPLGPTSEAQRRRYGRCSPQPA